MVERVEGRVLLSLSFSVSASVLLSLSIPYSSSVSDFLYTSPFPLLRLHSASLCGAVMI